MKSSIDQQIDRITERIKKRILKNGTPIISDINMTDPMRFATEEELKQIHELKQNLPSFKVLREQARERIRERIKNRG